MQVLQRIGMYPYRCEACDARFYRKVPVGEGLGRGRYKSSLEAPRHRGAAAWDGFADSREQKERRHFDSSEVSAATPDLSRTTEKPPPIPPETIPRVVAPPEAVDNSLTHEDFVDLIGHISRSEERKGLKVPEKKDEDA